MAHVRNAAASVWQSVIENVILQSAHPVLQLKKAIFKHALVHNDGKDWNDYEISAVY